MDPEQIRTEMRLTRASIDRKLERLSVRSAEARQQTIRAVTAVMVAFATLMAWSWWRRRTITTDNL